MMLRIAAAGAVVLGATILVLYLNELGKAPWSPAPKRHLREMKERTALPQRYDPMTFAAMAALPRSAPLAEYAAIERRAVSLEGYVQRIVRAPDGDIHLDFADTLDAEGRLVPYLSAEITPQWHIQSGTWRFERVMALMRPRIGGPARWDDPPRRLRLSGWLMYDYPYENEAPVFGFPPHRTLWEIHPVTRIEAWDDSLARFVEFAR
jgi:hypothetical protein